VRGEVAACTLGGFAVCIRNGWGGGTLKVDWKDHTQRSCRGVDDRDWIWQEVERREAINPGQLEFWCTRRGPMRYPDH
jgi:hypothetical protein